MKEFSTEKADSKEDNLPSNSDIRILESIFSNFGESRSDAINKAGEDSSANDFTNMVIEELKSSSEKAKPRTPEKSEKESSSNAPALNLPKIDWGSVNTTSEGELHDYPRPDEKLSDEREGLEFKGDLILSSLDSLEKGMPIDEAYALTAVHTFLRSNFHRFDKDRDGKVTGPELKERLGELEDVEKSKGLLNLLNDSHVTHEITHDLLGDTGSLTLEDLRAFKQKIHSFKEYRERQKKLVDEAFEISNYGLRNFESIDTNSDHVIERGELYEAINKAPDQESKDSLSKISDSFKYIANGPLGLPKSRFGLMAGRYISRSRLNRYVDEQYGNKFEDEHGIVANFKRGMKEQNIYFFAYDEQRARKHLVGENLEGTRWWQ